MAEIKKKKKEPGQDLKKKKRTRFEKKLAKIKKKKNWPELYIF